jgi:hypothetical protein
MPRRFELKHLVLHYIGMRAVTPQEEGDPTREKWRRQADKLQAIPELDPAIVKHLLALIEDTWDHPDAGGVHSARFDPAPEDPDFAKLQGYLKEMRDTVLEKDPPDAQAGQAFLALSQQIDDRLFECTTLAASPGLLMVADFATTGAKERYLALLKIRHSDERFVAILQESLTDLRVQDVDMMLTDEILKGMIWPHPTRPDYHLKLIDHQAKNRTQPAEYFAVRFLGCTAKETDARQAAAVSRQLPRALAKAHGLKLDPDQTDDFVVELIQQTAPTARSVAGIAADTGLISDAPAEQLEAAVAARLADDLPDILAADELAPDLAAIAGEQGWTYDGDRSRAFGEEMDLALRLDEGKVSAALVQTGLLQEAEAEPLLASLEAMGGLDVPRETLLMRTKTKRRLLHYRFRVPRRPDGQDQVEVTVSGLPETLIRFLTRMDGGNYVFRIEAPAAGFEVEYK